MSAELRTQMRRSETTTIPDVEPTVRLGPDRVPEGRVALGRYRIDQRLGAGGFGVVWRAHDLKLERDVAVKAVPRGRDEADQARTEREALAAAKLNHPGIVALYEFGYDDEHIYLVSELVEGATLGELTAEGALSDRDVANVGQALADALGHAHARGVIHRDVKPANVMVLAEPAAGAGFAKLTDLGVAHVAAADELTATGDVVGTLAYMAPEQAEGQRITAACDVYSLALTLYEAWTGTNPVRARGAAATARRLGMALPPLRSIRGDLPAGLGEVVDAALDPDPRYRPDPAELAEVLGDAADDLSDEGGLVEPETIERFGLTAVRARTRLMTMLHRGTAAAAPQPVEPWAATRRRALLTHAAAGLGAAALVVAGFAALGASPGFSPLVAAAGTALLVGALPRAGWLAVATSFCLWLASDGGEPGSALVLAVALAATPALLPRAGTLWSLPALAPLLGLAGLAPMFVGLAALAPTAWRRAGLAAAGFLWLAVAEVLTGRDLLFGVADGTLARARWEGSASAALTDALAPLVSSAALAPALAWAAFAVVLPLVVRGRWAALDLLMGALWAAALVMAHDWLGQMMSTASGLLAARGAVAGAALGALVAVTVILLAPPRPDATPEPALP